MEIGRLKKQHPTNVGEMLIAAGIINYVNLNEALHLAKKASSPVGRILLMTGALQQRDLDSALQAQSMVRSGSISLDFAINVLTYASRNCISFNEALAQQGGSHTKLVSTTSELAELLVTAFVVSNEQLSEALQRSRRCGIPLGRALILMGAVSPAVMATALTAQIMVRGKELTRETAIRGLRIAVLKRISLEQALIMEGLYSPPAEIGVKLGELLGNAGLLSETDALDAVETSIEEGEPVGEVLVRAGFISRELLETALELQALVVQKFINPQQAAELLRAVSTRAITLECAMVEMEQTADQVVDLLKGAGLVSDEDLKTSAAITNGQIVDMAQCLYDSAKIDRQILDSARRCQRMISQGVLHCEQAVTLLTYCCKSRVNVSQALQELAWDNGPAPVKFNPTMAFAY